MTRRRQKRTDLAGPTECESVSGTQPLPMGVAKNGKLVFSIKALIWFSALE
jgi:hypothetical protein